MTYDLSTNLLAAILFALLGIVIFIVAFVVVDKLTPGDLWHHIFGERNTAVAILLAGISIGLSIIIAAAIH